MHRSGQEPILTVGNDFGDLATGHQITRKGAGTLENMVMSEMAKQSLRGDKKGLLGREVRGLCVLCFPGLLSSRSVFLSLVCVLPAHLLLLSTGAGDPWPSPGQDAVEEQVGRSRGRRGCVHAQDGRGPSVE